MKIAVIGAGVNGLTCAVKIKEKYKDFKVVLISNEFTPYTTGDGSGGLWFPYLCGDTPYSLLEKWGRSTYNFLHELWKTGDHGISLMPIYVLYRDVDQLSKPEWASLVYGYQQLDNKQLEHFSQRYSTKYTAGQTFTTFISYPPAILSYLQQRFLRAHGEVLHAKISSLQDALLEQYDVVLNCTGLAARYIVPDDKVVPIRGQIAKVEAPWMTETIIDETTGNYIIPNIKTCVLGGTHQDDFNTQVDTTDTDFILNGCKKLVPGLEQAKLVQQWVGLRPGRESIRLEPEEKNGRLYIHNYGHGGSGLTLFWGCGSEVLKILDEYLCKHQTTHVTSKL